jgi:CO/xanthine dehydrogenase Mo-binding subunit
MPLDAPLTNERQFKVVGTRPDRPDGLDKVTGRARYGADMTMPGMLWGLVLRSPHAHARIKSIDASEALALPGVKAVVTGDDFDDRDDDLKDTLVNVMARGTALYDGHAVAAVAATSRSAARKALKLIKVDYDPLPAVVDENHAMEPDAPVIYADAFKHPETGKPSNIATVFEFGHGDVEAGFAKADVVIERTFKTGATHQGYIEPHACVASYNSDDTGEMWVCTQGHFMIRDNCARLLGMDLSRLRVTASEIGGGFGGKTTVFIEPVALMLSKKCGRPVKMVMSREEVFRATGPTSSSTNRVKIGATKDGRIVAAEAELRYQGGPFAGSPVEWGAMTAFACYDLENVKTIGYDVVCNRPKQAAYRAPGAPMIAFGVESVVDDVARELGIDPVDFRIQNQAKEGTKSSYGPTYGPIGIAACLEALKNSDHYQSPVPEGCGRGVGVGFWFNFGGQTCVGLNVNEDGTVTVQLGTQDIGGSRASMCQMTAEALGIPYDDVRAVNVDTSALGFTETTEGSRTTFSSGMALIKAAEEATQKMCARAAQIWGIPEEAVEWVDGHARPAGDNAGKFEPMSFKEIAAIAHQTGGPIAGHTEINATNAGEGFAAHICDLKVDPETGFTEVVRYTVVQDAGKAVHPSYVEGQMQGAAAQGIGWALNEEYIYDDNGVLQNPGFLDYRIPVCSDLPMLETVIVEVPNPGHPFGVRGVGETSIVPPLGAIGNAILDATGVRMTETPMSPPRLVAAFDRREAAE